MKSDKFQIFFFFVLSFFVFYFGRFESLHLTMQKIGTLSGPKFWMGKADKTILLCFAFS